MLSLLRRGRYQDCFAEGYLARLHVVLIYIMLCHSVFPPRSHRRCVFEPGPVTYSFWIIVMFIWVTEREILCPAIVVKQLKVDELIATIVCTRVIFTQPRTDSVVYMSTVHIFSIAFFFTAYSFDIGLS